MRHTCQSHMQPEALRISRWCTFESLARVIDLPIREKLPESKGALRMSCREIKKLLKKIEEDIHPPEQEPPSKPITFACAKLGLKEMIDTFEYLGPNRYTCESKSKGNEESRSSPSCKYGNYGDLHAKCSNPNQPSQSRPQAIIQEQQQQPPKPARNQQRGSLQKKPRNR